MYDDIHLHTARSYTSSPTGHSLWYDPHSVKPSPLRPSSLSSPLYFHLHCPPSYVAPRILSFLILSSFVTPHILYIVAFAFLQPPIYFPMPSSMPMSSSSFSCRITLRTLSSSSSTRSALSGWLLHPVLHPAATSIPCMRMPSLVLLSLSLSVNAYLRLDVQCIPDIQSSFY